MLATGVHLCSCRLKLCFFLLFRDYFVVMLANLFGSQYSNRAMHNARSFAPHFQKSSASVETTAFIQEPMEKFYEVGEEIGT